MSKTAVDSHGRLYLPKEIRERHGKEFRIVEFEGEVRLIPVAENPLEDLRQRTKKLRESDKSVEQLKQEAREELEELAGE
ncbi:MAG: AbrB/MazE/SpoVT family DNA-binding domain-containing protein [Candidatus Nanohalobium sp.]